MKIYIYVIEERGLLLGQALADDGSCLVKHFITNRIYSMHEMGITSRKHHPVYREHSADFELVDLTTMGFEELLTHPDFEAALTRNALAYTDEVILPHDE